MTLLERPRPQTKTGEWKRPHFFTTKKHPNEMKVYLTAGHTVINGKGTGVHSGTRDEAKEAAYLRDEIACYLERRNVTVIKDDVTTGFGRVMTWLNNTLTKSDTAIEIHFDASGSGGPNGCTAFVPINPTSHEEDLGRRLCKAIFEAAHIKPRGSNKGVRDEGFTFHKRLRFLHSPAVATNVLLEVCFITSDSDWNKYITNRDSIALMLSNSIYNHLKDRHNGKA